MLRSFPLAAVLLALLPAAASASALGLDVDVDKARITETTCPDGVTTIVEDIERWEAAGSADDDGGLISIYRQRIRQTWTQVGRDVDLVERDVDLLSERDWRFGRVAKRRGNRLIVSLRSFSPRKETLRPRIPGRGGQKRLHLPPKERREEQPADANGCVTTKIRAKTVDGSLEHFSFG